MSIKPLCVWIFTHASNSSVFHLNTICHHLKHIVWAYRANRTNNDKRTTIVVGFLTSLSYVIAVVDRCCYRRHRRRCRHRHRHHCFCGCYMYNFDVCFILCLLLYGLLLCVLCVLHRVFFVSPINMFMTCKLKFVQWDKHDQQPDKMK